MTKNILLPYVKIKNFIDDNWEDYAKDKVKCIDEDQAANFFKHFLSNDNYTTKDLKEEFTRCL